MRSRLWITSGVAAFVVLAGVTLQAQERPRLRDAQSDTAVRDSDAGSAVDREIAQCIGISNQEEIALATLAASKTQNQPVKQFAEKLAEHHKQIQSQLERFGAQQLAFGGQAGEQPERSARAATPAPPERSDVAQAKRGENAAERAAGTTRRTARREAGLNFMDVKRQMAQKCLAAARQEWDKHPDAEGDACFIGHQVVGHEQMLVALEVLKPHASPELQQVIDEGIQVTQSHLQEAKDLMNELTSINKTAGGARQEETRNQ